MLNDGQQLPIARNLNTWGRRRATAQWWETGKFYPAKVTAVTNSIVTVSIQIQQNETNAPYTIPNIVCPIAGPMWGRAPTQVGDLGLCIASDAYLGGASGLGSGQADLSPRANLSQLVFLPIGNMGWSVQDDPNSWVLYGPDGVILRDAQKQSVLTLNQTSLVYKLGGNVMMSVTASEVAFSIGGTVVATFTAAGIHSDQDVTVTGSNTSLKNHIHNAVQPGSGNSGAPVPGS